jgi:hypothetical protein
MDSRLYPTFDYRNSTISYTGRDLLNQHNHYNIIHVQLPPSAPSLMLSATFQRDRQVAVGEHADFWVAKLNDKEVVKVLRGRSSSDPDFLQKFKEVSFRVPKTLTQS